MTKFRMLAVSTEIDEVELLLELLALLTGGGGFKLLLEFEFTGGTGILLDRSEPTDAPSGTAARRCDPRGRGWR